MNLISSNSNLTYFPKLNLHEEVKIIIPTTIAPGVLTYFGSNDVVNNSLLTGLKFDCQENLNRVVENGTTATEADAKNALITLVDKKGQMIIKELPVNAFNVRNSTNYALAIRRIAKAEIYLPKCFIRWTDVSPANNLYFYFSFYLQKKQ